MSYLIFIIATAFFDLRLLRAASHSDEFQTPEICNLRLILTNNGEGIIKTINEKATIQLCKNYLEFVIDFKNAYTKQIYETDSSFITPTFKHFVFYKIAVGIIRKQTFQNLNMTVSFT
ncbi:hypothetical protein CDIK_0927 [Cucumispora dikerogammari]|nr:hypothetical protein CDIK_0927 [Cucumispora dikerogammari]